MTAGCLFLPLVFTIAWEDVFSLPKTIGLWLLATILSILLAAAFVRGARPLRAGPVDTAIVLFVLLSGAATIMSADPGHSLVGERLQYQGMLSMTAYAVLFVSARYATTDLIHVRLLALALLASGSLVSLYAVAQQLGLDPIWAELFKGRVFSTMGQANALAAVLATCLVFSPNIVARLTGRMRWAVLLGIGLTATAFLLTLSRGGYLGLFVGLVVGSLVLLRGLGWTAARRHVARGALIAGGVLVVFVIVALAWKPAGDLAGRVVSRAAMIVDLEESSNRIRLDLWTVGLRMAADKPFLGSGPDSYVLNFAEYRDEVLPADRAEHLARFRPESPHSVYLAIASGAGLPALGAFLVVLAGALWLCLRAALMDIPWEARLALAGLLAAATIQLVTNAFVTGEPASFAIWAVVLGALAGLSSRLLDTNASAG